MATRNALVLACLVSVAIPAGGRAAIAPEARCTAGTWTIDGGPIVVGPLDVGVVSLRDDGPALTLLCRLQRWALGGRDGETRVRALFSCRSPDDDTEPPRRFPLRLRARIAGGCGPMEGLLAIRRSGNKAVRFTATPTGNPCASDAECTAEAFCWHPPGECTATGTCEPRFVECYGAYAIVCGCDGQTYDFCTVARAGVSIAHVGPCSASCGGIAGVACPDGEYCELPAGQCGSTDLEGHCLAVGDACPEFYSPVCGCDGVTYANDCFRQTARAQKAHDGACDGVCGGIAGIPCPEGEFCELPAGECHAADLQGRCLTASTVCPDVYRPVCGCDGVTYENDCVRRAAGAQKAQDGPCECVPRSAPCASTCDCYRDLGTAFCDDCPLLCPSCGDYWQCKDGACVEQCGIFPPDVYGCFEGACGGIAGIPCPAGETCELPPGPCESTDLQGHCVPRTFCTLQYEPVCGCDGKTYGNDCQRRNAGVQKAHDGPC